MPRDRAKEKAATRTSGKSAYVLCNVEPGMFADEVLVSIQGVDPVKGTNTLRVQLLADAALVTAEDRPKRGRPVRGKLRVSVVRVQQGIATVVLPQPAIPVGEAMLVRQEQLTE
jgi:hypothetical protein